MKKLVIKFVQIAQIIFSAIFVIMLMLTVTGAIPVNVMDNRVVCDSYLKILLFIFAVLYAIMSIYIAINVFVNSSKIRYVRLSSDTETISYVNSNIIRKIAKKVSKSVAGLKVSKVVVFSTDENNISLNILVNVNTNDIMATLEKFRLLVIEAFDELLGIRFSSINFKTEKLKTSYTPDFEKIQDAYDKRMEEIARKKAEKEEKERLKREKQEQIKKEQEERERQKKELLESKLKANSEETKEVTKTEDKVEEPKVIDNHKTEEVAETPKLAKIEEPEEIIKEQTTTEPEPVEELTPIEEITEEPQIDEVEVIEEVREEEREILTEKAIIESDKKVDDEEEPKTEEKKKYDFDAMVREFEEDGEDPKDVAEDSKEENVEEENKEEKKEENTKPNNNFNKFFYNKHKNKNKNRR